MDPKDDPIRQAPTINGRHSRAWLVDTDAVYRARGFARDQGGDVCSWLIEAPWAHPIWHSYWIHLMHLRTIKVGPLAGATPQYIYLDNATHEMWVKALDPEQPRQPMLDEGRWRPLSPSNFAVQLAGETDESAAARVRQAVHMICSGMLSPDTDFIRLWTELFGDNMVRR